MECSKNILILKCLLLPIASALLPTNDRPIIGVMARELVWRKVENKTSVIEAAYVKYLEASGARVVPVLIYQPKEYYQDLLSKINGVLFPGGPDILDSNGYGKTGRMIFDIAVEMNAKGDYFPVWGTCLGFELLSYVAAKKNWLTVCSAHDLPSTLNFVPDIYRSRMFQNLDYSLKNMMEKEPLTANFHNWCLSPENYTKSGLDKFFKVLALSDDANNKTYISVMEAYKYPIYAIAFHPEKVLFEFVVSVHAQNVPHTDEAVAVSQYFSRFFVQEARKNTHRFPSIKAEDEALIYNYNPVFTAKYDHMPTETQYFF